MILERNRERDTSKARLIAVAVLFFLGWAALWVRAAYIQVVWAPQLSELAERQHLVAELERGERGEILDRKGRLLARSVRFESVYARPGQITDPQGLAGPVAGILGSSRREVLRDLRSAKSFVWLGRQVDDRIAAEIRVRDFDGIHLVREYGRIYPNGYIMGQLIGFVGIDGHGLEGLESTFDEHLTGKNAKFVVQRDASGKRLYLDAQGREIDIDGSDLILTIDLQIQADTEDALARAVSRTGARWGACLVVRVADGEILAWANYPFFNPNIYQSGSPKVWRNRLGLDVFEPGSTLKPFLVAAAMEENVVGPHTRVHCEDGRWRLSGKSIKDTHEYGELEVRDVLSLSSNIGMAKIGLTLGAQPYSAYLRQLGFGSATDLPVPGEAAGLMREAALWNDIDLAAASFGQGIGVTLPQLARAYLCLAADGESRELRLVRGDGSVPSPERIFSPETARAVREMMIRAVEQGTGTQAAIAGLRVGGKSGTAQKASPEGGYGGEYVSSFVALVPGDAPEYLVLAVLDEPQEDYYGGVVAAPVVREAAMKTLAYFGELPEAARPKLAVLPQDSSSSATARAAQAVRQVPARAGVSIAAGGSHVPDLVGADLRSAVEALGRMGVVPVLEGEGWTVSRQSPEGGSEWTPEARENCKLWLDMPRAS